MFSTKTRTFKAGEALARYRLVELTSTENQVQYPSGAATKGDLFVTCTAAASGASVACIPIAAHSGTFKLTAAAAIALGARVALSGAAGKVDDSGGPAVATALEAASADGEEIECVAVAQGDSLITADVADGTTLTNTTTETTLASVSIDGAGLKAGDVLEVFATVDVPSTNGTDTLTLNLDLGTETIATSGAVDVADNDIGIFHQFITIRTTGASGTVVGGGYVCLDAAGTLKTSTLKASATEDISGDVTLALTGTWSAASASNQCNSETFVVKHFRA